VTFIDGNALAGPLGEIFAVDLTVATSQCVSCGQVDPVAALHVYAKAPGMVARCPGCGEVVMRLVRTPTGASLDMRGCVTLQIPLPL
jgi:NAD-dependent SIR2 family protein deacetylase